MILVTGAASSFPTAARIFNAMNRRMCATLIVCQIHLLRIVKSSFQFHFRFSLPFSLTLRYYGNFCIDGTWVLVLVSEAANGASESERRVSQRKKRLKQEDLEPVGKGSSRGINVRKVSFSSSFTLLCII